MTTLVLIIVLLGVYCTLVFPVYVLGRRRGLRNSWAAFIPFLGVSIVLCESIGQSGWCSLIAFVPYVGPLALLIWTGLAVPDHHGRSQWWCAVLAFPGVNLIGYWIYAFTLPRQPEIAPA